MKRISGILIMIGYSFLMTSCFLYEDKVYNNPYDPKLTDGAYPIPYAKIQLDGDTTEWDSVTTFISDQTNEATSSGQPQVPGGDIDQFKIAQDDENLYFYLSTANGVPMETTAVDFSVGFQDVNGNFNLNFPNLSHTINQEIGWWSNYNYRIDDTNWDGYSISSSIRFSGLNFNDNAIEFGISKTDYWDHISSNTRVTIEMNTWYEPYATNFGDGNLDDLYDFDHSYPVVLKTVNEPDPSVDVPIVQFGTPSSPLSIDGNSLDIDSWTETGYWYQDFQNDDTSSGQDNCDIDKVYIKQDQDKVYFLLTFFDSNNFTQTTSYEIQIQTFDTQYLHNFYVEHNGSVWNTDYVAYEGTQYSAGTSVADGVGYGVEMEFQKDLTWPVIPAGPMYFRISARDSSSAEVDVVSFVGSYKRTNDPTPTAYGP